MKKITKKNASGIQAIVKKSLPTELQLDAIFEAIDFITSNTDAATDQKYYRGLVRRLNTVWEKNWKLRNVVGNVFECPAGLSKRSDVCLNTRKIK